MENYESPKTAGTAVINKIYRLAKRDKKGRALGPSSRIGICHGLESVVERRHDVLALGKSGLETVVPVATGL